MAYYDALKTKWATLTGTTASKLTQINALTVTVAAQPCILTPSRILNAVVPADLAALTAVPISMLTLVLQGAQVDASSGTTIRTAIQTIFAGKTTTLANLAALVAPYDSPTIPWWQSAGYSSPINSNDLVAAGNLT